MIMAQDATEPLPESPETTQNAYEDDGIAPTFYPAYVGPKPFPEQRRPTP